MALAGSSPMRIVARPGRRPVRCTNASTSPATSARTFAAIALPSMMSALTTCTLPALPEVAQTEPDHRLLIGARPSARMAPTEPDHLLLIGARPSARMAQTERDHRL